MTHALALTASWMPFSNGNPYGTIMAPSIGEPVAASTVGVGEQAIGNSLAFISASLFGDPLINTGIITSNLNAKLSRTGSAGGQINTTFQVSTDNFEFQMLDQTGNVQFTAGNFFVDTFPTFALNGISLITSNSVSSYVQQYHSLTVGVPPANTGLDYSIYAFATNGHTTASHLLTAGEFQAQTATNCYLQVTSSVINFVVPCGITQTIGNTNPFNPGVSTSYSDGSGNTLTQNFLIPPLFPPTMILSTHGASSGVSSEVLIGGPSLIPGVSGYGISIQATGGTNFVEALGQTLIVSASGGGGILGNSAGPITLKAAGAALLTGSSVTLNAQTGNASITAAGNASVDATNNVFINTVGIFLSSSWTGGFGTAIYGGLDVEGGSTQVNTTNTGFISLNSSTSMTLQGSSGVTVSAPGGPGLTVNCQNSGMGVNANNNGITLNCQTDGLVVNAETGGLTARCDNSELFLSGTLNVFGIIENANWGLTPGSFSGGVFTDILGATSFSVVGSLTQNIILTIPNRFGFGVAVDGSGLTLNGHTFTVGTPTQAGGNVNVSSATNKRITLYFDGTSCFLAGQG